jgi:glycerol-3-phosphate acyltransferase PlsY
VTLLLAALVGYLCGSISTATLVARRRGVDLRTVGSGNPGATNVGRALGRRAGAVVALLDVVKGLLPAAAFGTVDHRAGLVAGVAAVLGHTTSPLLRGRGGRGAATAAGAVLGSHPLWAVPVLLTWVVVVAASRWVALASVTAAASLMVVALIGGRDRLWAAVLMLIVLVRHRQNFARRLEARRRPPPLLEDPDTT